ncbi:uncharacterized protein BXZ73DRAFT_107047 [Epithele typhae]|uniref:uncharacterized protein n=1 Tax=Epithele typhae TaxID=378194 RepID=UPI00200864B9|nr:uncharacterized protein BXZ73DRAFT_107047 [Epithele typhae]KAH9913071.1 hypothetical protein BXZ73DRAFT_107047 [Epithele typhae]
MVTAATASRSPNSIVSVWQKLLKLILDFDASRSVVPHPYLPLAHPKRVRLSLTRISTKVSSRQPMMLDLRMDWLGLPSHSADGLYNAFTPLVEGMPDRMEAAGVALMYVDLRVCLSRAIASPSSTTPGCRPSPSPSTTRRRSDARRLRSRYASTVPHPGGRS